MSYNSGSQLSRQMAYRAAGYGCSAEEALTFDEAFAVLKSILYEWGPENVTVLLPASWLGRDSSGSQFQFVLEEEATAVFEVMQAGELLFRRRCLLKENQQSMR